MDSLACTTFKTKHQEANASFFRRLLAPCHARTAVDEARGAVCVSRAAGNARVLSSGARVSAGHGLCAQGDDTAYHRTIPWRESFERLVPP